MLCFMEQMQKNRRIDPHHVDVLDGIRAYSILLVLWFHFWQQNWLMPIWHVPAKLLPSMVGDTKPSKRAR